MRFPAPASSSSRPRQVGRGQAAPSTARYRTSSSSRTTPSTRPAARGITYRSPSVTRQAIADRYHQPSSTPTRLTPVTGGPSTTRAAKRSRFPSASRVTSATPTPSARSTSSARREANAALAKREANAALAKRSSNAALATRAARADRIARHKDRARSLARREARHDRAGRQQRADRHERVQNYQRVQKRMDNLALNRPGLGTEVGIAGTVAARTASIGLGIGITAGTGSCFGWGWGWNWCYYNPWYYGGGWGGGWGWGYPGWYNCWYPGWGWSCNPWFWWSRYYCGWYPWWNHYWSPYYYYDPYPRYYSTVIYHTYYDDEYRDSDPIVIYVDREPEEEEYYEEPYVEELPPAQGTIQATNPNLAAELETLLKTGDSIGTKEHAKDQFLNLGDRAFREGRYADAVHFYTKAIDFAPEEGVLYLILSDALFATGDYHYGAFALRKALELDPALVDQVVDKREFYSDPKEFDRQLAVLERYLQDRPIDQDARLLLAANYLFGGRPADTVDLLESDWSKQLREEPAAMLILQTARRVQYGTVEEAGKPF